MNLWGLLPIAAGVFLIVVGFQGTYAQVWTYVTGQPFPISTLALGTPLPPGTAGSALGKGVAGFTVTVTPGTGTPVGGTGGQS